MPRGVYQRPSADAAGKAVKPAAKKAPSKKKAVKPPVQQALVLPVEKAPPAIEPPASSAPITPPAADVPPVADVDSAPPPQSAIPVVPLEREEPIKGSVDDMSGDKLKRYARQIGISQRDVDGLTEGRLRQNCKAMIYAAMED